MGANKLKQNPGKTEFILFGSDLQKAKLADCFAIDILGSKLCSTDKVRNLGVWFDCIFSFSSHVSSICKSCFVGLCDFNGITRYLPKDDAVSLANALVSSPLDYCNSLFRSLSFKDMNRLQCIQNTLPRIVCNTPKYSHITPVLKSLDWLPVKYCSMFKTCIIIHKHLHTSLPKYLSLYISLYTSSLNTRRSNPANRFLNKPESNNKLHTSKTHFNNSFAWDRPNLWNRLPHNVHTAPLLYTFRYLLKAYLLQKAFPLNLP